LIVDGQGHAMSPSHANKGTRRYRYYTSQALLLYRYREAGSVVRVPAEDVETVVVNELKRRLETPLRLLEMLDTDGWSAHKVDQVTKRGQGLAREWDELPVSDRIDYLKDLIRQVTVSRESIEIVFSTDRWASVLLPNAPDARIKLSDVTMRLPAKLRRSGRETRLVIENSDPLPASAASREALRSAVEKAMRWNDQLIKGDVTSARAIAEREDVSERYIWRILHLALLAPDIVRVVQSGEAPETLTLARLKKGYPLAWAQQRAVLLGR
jgi:site-specific DNA recombinase